jgi:integrase/recombinase XerD
MNNQNGHFTYQNQFEYKVDLIPFKHRGGNQIGIKPSKNGAPYEIVKGLGAKYTITHRYYYLENTAQNLNKILNAFKGKAWVDLELLNKHKLEQTIYAKRAKARTALNKTSNADLIRFKTFMVAKNYSQSTINTYVNLVSTFLGYFNDKEPNNINHTDVEDYLKDHVVANAYSNNYHRQVISALKCFYGNRYERELDLKMLPRVKKDKQLPKVIDKSEIETMIQLASNYKHKAILVVIYGCGLRVGEMLNLKPNDVDSKRKMLLVKNGKGKKDRMVTLNDKIINTLREYYKLYRPKYYLFEGAKPGMPYTRSSTNAFIKKYAQMAGVKKHVHAHMLRHCYGTHMLEGGTDLRYIQTLMGHKSSKTTEIYTYVSKDSLGGLPNPTDDMDF